MRPDDDLKLAKLVKKHGFKQGAAFGTELLGVEWRGTKYPLESLKANIL